LRDKLNSSPNLEIQSKKEEEEVFNILLIILLTCGHSASLASLQTEVFYPAVLLFLYSSSEEPACK